MGRSGSDAQGRGAGASIRSWCARASCAIGCSVFLLPLLLLFVFGGVFCGVFVWAVGGGDFGVLFDGGGVLCGEGGGDGEFAFAEVAVGCEGGVGSLG